MATKALIVKSKKTPKYKVREYTRCRHIIKGNECGRSKAVFREFMLCRIHLRESIYKGLIPGFKKASW